MRASLMSEGDTTRPGFIPLFAGKPSHPFVPLGHRSAVARSGGPGRPPAGAPRAPSTAASTMARSRPGGDPARSRLARLLLASLLAITVPSAAVPAQTAPPHHRPAGDPYADHVADAARRFGIPPAWIRAVMAMESGGERGARSPKGALGLMQLMPETWAELRARYGLGHDPFDPHDNILAGAAFMRELHDRYGSPGFLAAYNAGPGRYEDYRDRNRPLPAETITYVTALAPLVGDGPIATPVATAASDPSNWTGASLFVVRPDGPAAASDRRPRDTSTVGAVRDLTAIVPPSGGLFVALSTPGRMP